MPIYRHIFLAGLLLSGCQAGLNVSGKGAKDTRTRIPDEEKDDDSSKDKSKPLASLTVKAEPGKTVCVTADAAKLKGAKLCVLAGSVAKPSDVKVSLSANGDLRFDSDEALLKPIEISLPEALYEEMAPGNKTLVFITDSGEEKEIQGVKQADGSYLITVTEPGRLVAKDPAPAPGPAPTPAPGPGPAPTPAPNPAPGPAPSPTPQPVIPTIPVITASAEAADGVLNIADSASSTAIFTLGALAPGETVSYTEPFAGTVCPAAGSFTRPTPPAPEDFVTDGEFSVCLRIVGADSGDISQTALTLTVDLSAPVFTSLLGANEASDGVIDASEISSTSAAFSSVVGTDITSTAYTALLDADSNPDCDGTQTYNQSAVPNISDISVDGAWLLCVRLTDANGNITYGTSATIQRASTPPEVHSFTAVTTTPTEIKISFAVTPLSAESHELFKIVRSAGSASTGVAAPDCASGTVIAAYTAPISAGTVFDSGRTATHYYSYRACYSDKFGNENDSSTVIDVRANGPGAHLVWNFADMDGNGVLNAGDISANTTTTITDGSGNARHGTLANFDFDSTSGWKGNGTPAEPYRLMFDGVDDRVHNDSNMLATKTYSFWTKVVDSQRNCDGAETSFIISRRDSGYRRGSVMPCATGFTTTYRDSNAWGGTALGAGWNHILTTYTGGAQRVYVNGIYVNQLVSTEENITAQMSLGSKYDEASALFNGDMALFETYPAALTAAQARDLFERDRTRFESEVTSPTVSRVVGGYADIAGGSTVTVYGWKLHGVQTVTIGGVNAAFTVETRGSINITAPALPAGQHNIALTFANGAPITLTGVYDAVEGIADSIEVRVDAARPNTITTGHSGEFWHTLTNGHQMAAKNLNNNANSGWMGTGTTGDPYRFALDGTDDFFVISTGSPIVAASVWFRMHSIDTFCDYRHIFYKYNWNIFQGTGLYACQNNRLYAHYRQQVETYTTISTNTWYHFVMTNDGSNVYYYLNGVQFGTGAVGVEVNPGELYLGSSRNSNNTIDGDIAVFTQYSRHLTPAEVDGIYQREKVRFP